MSELTNPVPIPQGDGRHDIGDAARVAIVNRLIDDWRGDPDLSEEKARQLAISAAASVRGLFCELGILRDMTIQTTAALTLLCRACGKPATCIGRYEGHGDYAPACDACCGHGNEDGVCWPLEEAICKLSEMALDRDRLDDLLNTPELHDFSEAVVLEAAHQRERWPAGHDADKTDADWYWLVGYLAAKALFNPLNHGENAIDKRLHRIITVAAVAANWHARVAARHLAEVEA